jgi:hypothetical protein
MTRDRPGKTVKVSVSLPKDDLVVLERYAKSAHDGNLSAAFADAAKWIRQREAGRTLVALLGGPVLTPAASAAIDAEQRGIAAPATRRRRSAQKA